MRKKEHEKNWNPGSAEIPGLAASLDRIYKQVDAEGLGEGTTVTLKDDICRVQERFAPWEEVVGGRIPRQYQRWPYLTEKEWRQNVDAVKYYARRRPIKIVDLLAERMKLTKDEKALYFGAVLEKLKQDAGL